MLRFICELAGELAEEDERRRKRLCPCVFDTDIHSMEVKWLRCESNKPLQNHITFPPVEFLASSVDRSFEMYLINRHPLYPYFSSPLRHWASLFEIAHVIDSPLDDYKVLNVWNQYGERVKVYFDEEALNEQPSTFSWSDLEPGHTLVVLYPRIHIFRDGDILSAIVPESLSRCCVFRAPIKEIEREAQNVVDCAQSREVGKKCACSSCGCVRDGLKYCAGCFLARYCDKVGEFFNFYLCY